jgi:hypothetical protein
MLQYTVHLPVIQVLRLVLVLELPKFLDRTESGRVVKARMWAGGSAAGRPAKSRTDPNVLNRSVTDSLAGSSFPIWNPAMMIGHVILTPEFCSGAKLTS